ncbi:MAG: phosphoribosylglycinamide formyltransferase [Flavobacterium sp.]|nr:MAG: phosphoribosylglycinamide formyltransferase [Flavobacterium sp.]
MKHIVIFASGSGSNAENIIRYFQQSGDVKVAAVFSNRASAGVLQRAEMLGVETIVFSKDELADSSVRNEINKIKPDLIVLAGFLLKFPEDIVDDYPRKIINVHPALLPKFGGKGMYGMNVHRSVLENKETETGITIHFVDAHYDEGDIIFQQRIPLDGNESCEQISEKVQQLEHKYFPEVIAKLLAKS